MSINEAANAYGMTYSAFKRSVENNGIELIRKKRNRYMKKHVFQQLLEESKQVVGFKEILIGLTEILNLKFNPQSVRHLNRIITYIAGHDYFGIHCINCPVYKMYDPLNFYIYIRDKHILEAGIKEFLMLFQKNNLEKLSFLCDNKAFDDKQITIQCIKEYTQYVSKDTLATFVESVNFLRLTAEKDLSLYSDHEILAYAKVATTDLTKYGCINLFKLYAYMQTHVACASGVVLEYSEESRRKRTRQPYEMEPYMKLAYMVFNTEYWTIQNMIHKAVLRESHAKAWLYHAMHYICDWRKGDLLHRIPRVSLEYPAEKILHDVEADIIPVSKYKKICQEIVMKINYQKEKPNKTGRLKNTPPLRLYIPQTYEPVIGMLVMICEAHNQMNGRVGKGLCYTTSITPKVCIDFFGVEYSNLFNGKILSNQSANKSHLNMLSNTGGEVKMDGYLIAHYARSHTGGINSISDVTAKYLRASMDGYSIDEISKTLFERGVCSFVPYLFCKLLQKVEFEKSNIKEQTIMINNLKMQALDIENILGIEATIAENIKQQVVNIIKLSDGDNLNEFIKQMLENIANEGCLGKNEGVYCFRKACGKACYAKKRKTCIGCGYEMYVKAFVMELRDEIRFQENALNKAKTQGEQVKRTAILKGKLYPAVCELLTTVKYLYGQDVEAMKNLFAGDDGHADFCLNE